jgi:hypothetical protein
MVYAPNTVGLYVMKACVQNTKRMYSFDSVGRISLWNQSSIWSLMSYGERK